MIQTEISIPETLLQAYSRAEISRREIAARLGEDISFGSLLRQLQDHHLPLPRISGDPHSAGIRLIEQLASHSAGHG